MNNADFIKIYNDVFDSKGNITVCGREKCKNLIQAAQEIDNSKNYGDISTGIMNMPNIENLHHQIMIS